MRATDWVVTTTFWVVTASLLMLGPACGSSSDTNATPSNGATGSTPDAGLPTDTGFSADAGASPTVGGSSSSGSPDTQEAAFTVTELPSIDGVSAPNPLGINTSGDVVGYYNPDYRTPTKAFLYSSATGTICQILDDGRSDTWKFARAINDAGDVAGSLGANLSRRAVVWNGGQATVIDTADPSLIFADALGINCTGHVVGYAQSFSSAGAVAETRAFLWDGATLRYLATDAAANAVNVSDKAVGSAGIDTPGKRPAAVTFQDGRVTPLPVLPPGAMGARALAINDTGRVVGIVTIDYWQMHAFVYDLPDGPMRDVSPGWQFCQLEAVNAKGVAVGTCSSPSAAYAAILRGSEVELLSDVFSSPEWNYLSAHAINNRGDIVGQGIHNGQWRGYVIRLR